MLDGVAAFVAGDGCRRDAAARIDRVAQIDGHRLRIEVVGQLSADVGDLHIVDLVVAQHLFGDFRTGESAGERHFGVFFEDVLQAGLHDVADYAATMGMFVLIIVIGVIGYIVAASYRDATGSVV